jgi:hypothetical protein
MLPIPYKRLTFKTDLGPDDIRWRLSSVVGPESFEQGISATPHTTQKYSFRGTIDKETFYLTSTRLAARNRIDIWGKICDDGEGTKINVTMMVPLSTWFFLLIIWLFGNFAFDGFKIEKILISIIVLGVFYVSIVLLFQLKVSETKSELEAIFGAYQID